MAERLLIAAVRIWERQRQRTFSLKKKALLGKEGHVVFFFMLGGMFWDDFGREFLA